MSELIESNSVTNSFTQPIDLGLSCASFFSMHKVPFTRTPVKAQLFHHQNYSHVKNTLLFALTSGEKLIKVTGKTGTGKTLLINDVLSTIDHQFYPIKLLNPQITPKDLLCQIIDEFGLPYPANANIEQLMRLLRFTLYEHYTKINSNIIVWLDDAHLLPERTLLFINKMGEWSTPTRPLIQFIISGSCELNDKLNQPQLLSLKNNIRFEDQLTGISKKELGDYVFSYIQSFDKFDQPQFTPKALNVLYKYSKGNPSCINKLAYKSLLQAFGKGLRTITHHYVAKAAMEHDLLSDDTNKTSKWRTAIVGWTAFNIIVVTIFIGSYL